MTDDQPLTDDSSHVSEDGDTVMQLFGIDVKVKNPRLAELLKMDASEALRTDVKKLADPANVRATREELREALPDNAVCPATPHDRQHDRHAHALRSRVDAIGDALDFDVQADGTWVSSTGHTLYVRVLSDSVSYASASDFLHKLIAFRKRSSSDDEGFLVVTPDQRTSDLVGAAIRQGSFHRHTRTVSLPTLERIRSLVGEGEVDQSTVLAWLLPIAGVDVATLLPPLSE